MNSKDIRDLFLSYFRLKGHTIVESSSLIPADDPTLLFTNAGMNQFKDVFLSKEKRSYKKAASIQKCIRAGGKHNDLENVGFTKRHLTFFEMMGNFSFGDYFKEGAITLAWDFLVNHLKIDKSKLYVSVYYEDQESFNIWKDIIKISESKIVKLGKEDNFWQMADVGPCGPCSEIYVYNNYSSCIDLDCTPGSCDRFLEIWNLVFMEYNKDIEGNLIPLKNKGVDTGMGFERLLSVIENKDSVFETSVFKPLISAIEELTTISYKDSKEDVKVAFRVLSDHIRSVSFAIADGALPSNEGRGYVLRKIIRRALLFERKLNTNNVFVNLVNYLADYFKDIYKDIKEHQVYIKDIIKSEVDKFSNSLFNGHQILEKYFKDHKAERIVSGKEAFKLYDTYGFPLELTKVIAQDFGFIVDIQGFEKEMELQKERSGKKNIYNNDIDIDIETEFTGYDEHRTIANIKFILKDNKKYDYTNSLDIYWIITDKSPFYVECGGQISDQGYIIKNNHKMKIQALKKIKNGIAFAVQPLEKLEVGDTIELVVDSAIRIDTMKNHTATHLLQASLNKILSNSIRQTGSLVTNEYLRFDFAYNGDITQDIIDQVEFLVNSKILENIKLEIKYMPLKDAIKLGAKAFFEEKYNPENVRVVEIPSFSIELCGGTHVFETGDIGLFKILEYHSLSASNKRIVAITGFRSLKEFQNMFKMVKSLAVKYNSPLYSIGESIIKEELRFNNKIDKLNSIIDELIDQNSKILSNINDYINNIPFVYLEFHNFDLEYLKKFAQKLNKLKPAFYLLVNKDGIKNILLSSIDNKFVDDLNLEQLVKYLKNNGLSIGISKGKYDTLIQGGFKDSNYNLKNLLNDFYKN